MSIKLTLSSFKPVTWSYMITVLHPLFKTGFLTWLKNVSLKHIFIRSNILLVKALPCRLDQEPLLRICKTEGPVNSAFEADADQVECLLKFTNLVTPDNFRVSLIHLETIELVFFFVEKWSWGVAEIFLHFTKFEIFLRQLITLKLGLWE